MFNDVYVLNIPTLTWTQLYPSGETPIERRNPTGVYDFFNDNFFIFGGDLGGNYYLGETYLLHRGSGDISEWQVQPILNIPPTLLINTVSSGSVRIRYILPKICHINIKILDASGRVVKNLFSGKTTSFSNCLLWDRRGKGGQWARPGIYYCFLQTEQTGITEKFIITK